MGATKRDSFYQAITDTARFLFYAGTYSLSEKADLTQWILSHQNRYKDFIFYPTKEDRENGIHLFSGEKPRAKFLYDNIVELETLRILALINPHAPDVREIFKKTNKRLFPLCFANKCDIGECAHASIAFMRYLTAYDIKFYASRVKGTLELLKKRRNGNGRWRGYPFFFTTLWLTELPDDMAQDELAYAYTNCLKLNSRKTMPFDQINLIRKEILHRALTNAANNQVLDVTPRRGQGSLIQFGL